MVEGSVGWYLLFAGSQGAPFLAPIPSQHLSLIGEDLDKGLTKDLLSSLSSPSFQVSSDHHSPRPQPISSPTGNDTCVWRESKQNAGKCILAPGISHIP